MEAPAKVEVKRECKTDKSSKRYKETLISCSNIEGKDGEIFKGILWKLKQGCCMDLQPAQLVELPKIR